MQQALAHREFPRLTEFVAEASRALAQLDTPRLEELALCCQALNRQPRDHFSQSGAALVQEVREAMGEMATFARVLEATRANLEVMRRLEALRTGRLEYARPAAAGWRTGGGRYGND